MAQSPPTSDKGIQRDPTQLRMREIEWQGETRYLGISLFVEHLCMNINIKYTNVCIYVYIFTYPT